MKRGDNLTHEKDSKDEGDMVHCCSSTITRIIFISNLFISKFNKYKNIVNAVNKAKQ